MPDTLTLIAILGGASVFIFLMILGFFAFLNAFYKTVEQGHALIITKSGGARVSFTGSTVLPIVHRYEVMDISLKTIEVDRHAQNGLICKDNIRADIKVTFFVRVNKTEEDVLRVATSVGVARASDPKTLENLFQAKFSEALKTVGKRMIFVDLYNERDKFKDEIVQVIGRDLNGYSLDAAAIDYLEQTPITMLDPDNILDSEGRKKIIELTAIQKMKANEIERESQKTIKKQDVEAREAILALERQQAEAEAKQTREIATNRARENAEQARVEAEEKKRSREAQIQVEQELAVQQQNAQREVEIASKNREGAVMVENERVLKERDLEVVVRERAVELSRIEREKIIAQERKQIAEVIRERVVVERGVAEEEERIKDVHVLADAKRVKSAAILDAERQAEEIRIREVVQAEGTLQASQAHAKEKILLAEADQAAAEKEAVAMIRRSEARQAHEAASGLAQVRVKELDAAASEKQGLAKARVMEAEGEAAKKRGLNEALVKEANVEAQKKQGLAEVAVKEATANAIELQGHAEAVATEQRLVAEARGLTEKAGAMAKMTESTRSHEEFRLTTQAQVEVAKAKVDAQVKIAEWNSAVMAEAMKKADFQIVGGDGAFFDRFVQAVTTGKTIDATVQSSQVLQTVGKEYLEGGRSLPDDVKEVLTKFGSHDVANLSVAEFLSHLSGKDPSLLKKLTALLKPS
ncbi:hypothetical protein LBMAG53_37720 [Planctomycetota bacterium]|nr:hypothetical protein LBMAG53_37720 [Planctomycetota bacterium]